MPIKIHQNKKGEIYHVVTARNGKILASTEGLEQKGSLLKNIASLIKAANDGIIIDYTGKFKQFKQAKVKPKK